MGGGSGAWGMAGSGGDAGTGGAAGDCPVGAAVTATLAADGGTLSLCGAELTVPQGALSVATEFGIQLVESPVDPPFEREFGAPIYRFTPDDDMLPFSAKLSLALDPTDTHYHDLAFYNEAETAWYGIEPCPEGTALSIQSARMGLWTLLRDTNEYPSSSSGLGEASLQLTFLGEAKTFQVDSSGYAIFETGGPDSRSVYLSLWRTTPNGSENLDMRWGQDPTESGLLQVTYFDSATSGLWSWLQPVDGPPIGFDVSVAADGRVQGTFAVALHRDSVTETMSGTLDVLPEKYRFPQEASCGE